LYDPAGDLNLIWKAVKEDTAVLSLMGLSDAEELTIRKCIINKSQYEDLANSEKRLCIFFRPSRPRINNLVIPEVIEIDCHVPSAEHMTAYAVIDAVMDVLHGELINKKHVEFYGQLGELATAPGYFCVGARFRYHTTIK
jgi:hypothetical protein